jgi:hypothetical protein
MHDSSGLIDLIADDQREKTLAVSHHLGALEAHDAEKLQ